MTGRLTWPFRSTPTFLSAVTEWGLAGSPVRLATPAETTLSERSGSGWAASACCRSAAPIGLRQMFPVQTTRMCPGSGIGSERDTDRPKRQNPNGAAARPAQILLRARSPRCSWTARWSTASTSGPGRRGLVGGGVRRLAVREVLLLEVGLVDPRLRGVVAQEGLERAALFERPHRRWRSASGSDVRTAMSGASSSGAGPSTMSPGGAAARNRGKDARGSSPSSRGRRSGCAADTLNLTHALRAAAAGSSALRTAGRGRRAAGRPAGGGGRSEGSSCTR